MTLGDPAARYLIDMLAERGIEASVTPGRDATELLVHVSGQTVTVSAPRSTSELVHWALATATFVTDSLRG